MDLRILCSALEEIVMKVLDWVWGMADSRAMSAFGKTKCQSLVHHFPKCLSVSFSQNIKALQSTCSHSCMSLQKWESVACSSGSRKGFK